jgi:acyl carrier protein
MSETDEVLEAVKALVARFAPPGAALGAGTELTTDLNIDSVAAMDLVMELEDKYDIDMPVNQIADLRTLGDLAALVRARLEARA